MVSSIIACKKSPAFGNASQKQDKEKTARKGRFLGLYQGFRQTILSTTPV